MELERRLVEGGWCGGLEAAAAWGRRHREGDQQRGTAAVSVTVAAAMAAAAAWGSTAWHDGDVLVVGARNGGGNGDGGDSSWTPSSTLCEQPLEREETRFFSQMRARVCGGRGGGGSLPL